MHWGGGNWKALYEAAKTGDIDEVRDWLSSNVNPNTQHPEFGTTPLIVAAEKGHLAVVKLLVEGGADPKVKSAWDGYDAVGAADKFGHPEVARWLREQSA